MVTETRGLHITAQNFLPYIPVAWKTRHSSFSDWARGIRSEQGPLISTYSHYSVQKLTTLTFLFSCQFLNPPPHPLFYSLLLLSPHPSLSLTLLSNLPPQWPPLPRNSPLSNPPSPDWTKSGLSFSQFQSFYLRSLPFSFPFSRESARSEPDSCFFLLFFPCSENEKNGFISLVGRYLRWTNQSPRRNNLFYIRDCCWSLRISSFSYSD